MNRVTVSFAALALVAAGVVAIPSSNALTATPIKILAIGDSITEDNPANLPGASAAWRSPLLASLTAAGRTVEFVGSHNLDSPRVVGLTGHEAFGGWATCDFFPDTGRPEVRSPVHAASWDLGQSVASLAPDVAVIDLGTNNYINDLYQQLGFTATNLCPGTAANFARAFDAVVLAPSRPRVVITTVEDASIVNGTDPINAIIRSYVAAKSAAGYQVCLAELPASFAGLTNAGDRYHLNATGKAAVAAALLAPTQQAIDSSCAASSTPTTTTTVPSTTTTVPASSISSSTSSTTTTVPSTSSTTTVPAPVGDRLYASSVVPPGVIELGAVYAVETVVRINVACTGSIAGVSWYRPATDTGTVTVSAWRNGSLAASAAAPASGPAGWAFQPFPAPLAVTAGQQLLIGVHHPNGAYAYRSDGFLNRAVASAGGCLTAPASTSAAPNGIYTYSALPVAGALSYRSTEYFVSPEFLPASAPAATTTLPPSTTTSSTTTAAPSTTSTTSTTSVPLTSTTRPCT